MKKLGMSAGVQPRSTIMGGIFHRVHSKALADATPPFRAIQESGLMWGLGTDAFEVNQYRPFTTLSFAVTGKMVGGDVVNTQTISREDALIAHTRSNAYFVFQENNLGSIASGKLADLVVLDRDYLTVPADQIKDIQPVMTLVGGKIVWDRCACALTAVRNCRPSCAGTAGRPAPTPARGCALLSVSASQGSATPSSCACRATASATASATWRNSFTGGSRRPFLSCRAGDKFGERLGRRHEHRIRHAPCIGRQHAQPEAREDVRVVGLIDRPQLVLPIHGREGASRADDRASLGPRQQLRRRRFRPRCRIGQRKDDRPLRMRRHLAHDRLGQRARLARHRDQRGRVRVRHHVDQVDRGSDRLSVQSATARRDCTNGPLRRVDVVHPVDQQAMPVDREEVAPRRRLVHPGIGHRLEQQRADPASGRACAEQHHALLGELRPVTLIAASSAAAATAAVPWMSSLNVHSRSR